MGIEMKLDIDRFMLEFFRGQSDALQVSTNLAAGELTLHNYETAVLMDTKDNRRITVTGALVGGYINSVHVLAGKTQIDGGTIVPFKDEVTLPVAA